MCNVKRYFDLVFIVLYIVGVHITACGSEYNDIETIVERLQFNFDRLVLLRINSKLII